jgi:hypothetical protein
LCNRSDIEDLHEYVCLSPQAFGITFEGRRTRTLREG